MEGGRVIWQFCTHATGSGKQLSKFSLILCNLCTPGSIYRSTSRPRYVDRPIYRSHVGWHIDQHIGRVVRQSDTSLILGYLVDCSLHCRRNLTQVSNVC